MQPMKDILTTWGTVTKVITGTAASVLIIIASANWFQGSAAASVAHDDLMADAAEQHGAIIEQVSEQFAEAAGEDFKASMEAELQRIELALKMYASIRERRSLTPDEQDELEYLKARRLQIRDKLFGQ